MSILILLIIITFVSCAPKQEHVDFQHVLETAQQRANQSKSLSEDTLLCQALEYYQTLEPRDTARLSQATILTAIHYWWMGEKAKAYELLQTVADTDKNALQTLYLIACKDYDYEAGFTYLNRIIEDERRNDFYSQQALATLNYYLNRPDECERLFNDVIHYIRTPDDSLLYWRQVLPNYADILSDYGKHDKAIELQKHVLHHFMGKDSAKVAFSYAALSRYYLLQNNLKEAKRHLHLAEENATEQFRTSLAMAGYMQLLRSILHYATDKHINMMEWANYANQLQENAYIKQAITDAKEESKRLLTERNLKLTIKQQQLQITFTYVGIGLIVVIGSLIYYTRKKKRQVEEKEEELETLRKLAIESQQCTQQKDDRFFKRILLQQLGVIRMAASNPTTANQELIRRMSEIVDGQVPVDSLLNWEDLYKTIDYIYDNYYTRLKEKYNNELNEKEIQLCCLLKANFSTKEISIVTGQGVRTVYQRKTVIRQKLGMEEKEDIAGYLS